ncbi:hypothetical protein ACFFRR_003396 [Megaselia abdita]
MNYKVFLLAFFISAVVCEESSEEDSQSSENRIYNNGQPLTIPQLLQIPNFNGGYNPTTALPQLGQYNPTTASPLYVQNQGSTYNPTTASPLYIQSQQPTFNPTTAYNPTTSYNPTTASPLYVQQSQGQQPIQVIQIPNQTQKPNNIYVQTQPQNQGQPQVVVIPNKKPGRPSRPNKRPTTTVQPPIYVQTQPQQHHTQTPIQVIQVQGKPTTASTPIVIQTQQPHQGHRPVQVITVPNQQNQGHQVITVPNQQNQGHQIITVPNQQNQGHQVITVPNQQIEPQQEIYQIYPGQLDNPTDYEFNWFVNNQENGDYKSHREVRQNDVVQGQYEVVDPDGYRRIVSYTADELHGFRAVVRRIPLNAGYVQTTQRPFYNNNNNYFGASTTQRPFGSRGKKHASVAPLENSSTEKESEEK